MSDLGNLIGLYREWHKHLLPYYSFDQFVHKVDRVASSKRVKVTDLLASYLYFFDLLKYSLNSALFQRFS